MPLLRGPRGPHTARGLGRAPRRRRAATPPGWTGALGARTSTRPCRRPRAPSPRAAGAESGDLELDRPARRRHPRPARPVRLPARGRGSRGDRQRAPARDLDGPARCDRLAGAVGAWRERMRAHRDAACVHLIVNEGPRPGPRSSTPRPALRAQLRPGRGRPRARAGHRLPRANHGRPPARRRRDRGGAPARAPGRGRRRGAADLPVGVALAVRAAGGPAPAAGALRGRRSGEPAMLGTASARSALPSADAAAQPVRFAPPRAERRVLLAHRRPPAARHPGRVRARVPGSRSTPTRSAPRPTCGRARGGPAMSRDDARSRGHVDGVARVRHLAQLARRLREHADRAPDPLWGPARPVRPGMLYPRGLLPPGALS